jgi:hypothetical protein
LIPDSGRIGKSGLVGFGGWVHPGSTTETGGKDAAITGTQGCVPLRSGSHPWLPVNAASSRVSQMLVVLSRLALGFPFQGCLTWDEASGNLHARCN